MILTGKITERTCEVAEAAADLLLSVNLTEKSFHSCYGEFADACITLNDLKVYLAKVAQ